ncbi:DMT family transporter [Enterovirga rhinocerotis]|uniref:Threonine/homoserine efflux transporter RhtA n=1 Tax=Enterovirga rhinocerotis TaxID=1339210 RepID=A0A4R7BNV4_9HYPH|nr:DMT family transporter [Enterovirga rhinocerotis]TDR87188.1 threonine/homoserine efflux transporter RhtA [Enterovirga rhinocerotis]
MPVPTLHPKPPVHVGAPLDRPLAGIVLAISAGVFFAASDATSKYLTPTLPVIEIAWMRWFGFLAIVTPIIVYSRGDILRSRRPSLQMGRSICLIGSSLFFIMGVSSLPLASATTLNFISPMLVTALSIPLLGEQVGIRRWSAIAVGLLGVVIIVRPGSGAFDPAVLYPMLSAASWAMAIILTRKLAGIDRPWTAMCYSAIVGFIVLSVAVIPVFVMPSWREIGLAAFLACAATAGQYLTVLAFQRAPASLLAPFTYVQLIWATALGYLVFGNLPDGWTGIGAAIIIASGVYTAHRERIRLREARAARG